jgi:RNA polymerase sigma-70 factor (ECF subfamily)
VARNCRLHLKKIGCPWGEVSVLPRQRHAERVNRIVPLQRDADDVFQEVWLKVVERAGSYDAARPFGPWLASIAANAAIDWGRKQKQHLSVLQHQVVPGLLSQHSVESEALNREAQHASSVALRSLPRALREVIELRYFDECSEKTMARVLGVPAGTVKSRLRYALSGLRARLEAVS